MRLWGGDPHRKLIERARAGDREAFRALYRDLFEPVSRFVSRRLARREDVEDVVSKVFHRLLTRLDDFDAARGSVQMFIFAMARNAVIDHLRTRHEAVDLATLAEVLPDETPGILDWLVRREDLARMAALIARLPEDLREILLLRFGDGLSHSAIAGLVGGTADSIRMKISRTLRDLKNERTRHEEAQPTPDRPKPGPDGERTPGTTHSSNTLREGAHHVRI